MAQHVPDSFNNWRPLLAFSLPIIFSALASTWYLSAQMNDYSSRLKAVEDDRYSLTMASERALRQAIENPGMRVPDPRDPSKIITVLITEDQP